MGYQVLARKWRPRSFHEVVGQQHVLTALVNALDQGRLHHAYLFSGTRGVGKTTIARILAKCLNCEQGVTSRPCGVCDSCREIDQGNFVDLLEIDAASRTKVEDTRELLDNVQYRPARGRFKVYLIDEVHMLSRHSFNALLKTLEEPPPYVKFLLATTDPQKLPITILSRCLQFHLKALNREQISGQLAQILDAEGQPYEQPALVALAKAADGSMRDALSLTDQALAHGNGHVHLDQVLSMLGTLDHRHLHQMLHGLAKLDGPGLLAKINEVAQLGPDFDLLLAELAGLLHRMALAQLLGSSPDPLALDSEEVLALSALFTPEELQLYYQICLTGRKELPLAPDGRSGFEMTMLRMLAFAPARQSSQQAHFSAPVTSTLPAAERPSLLPNRPVSPAPVAAPAPASSQPEQADDEEPGAAALYAEQARILADATALGGEMAPAERIAATAVTPSNATEPASVAEPAPVLPADSGVNSVLQFRNRLRSQSRESAQATPSHPLSKPVVSPAPRVMPAAPAPAPAPTTSTVPLTPSGQVAPPPHSEAVPNKAETPAPVEMSSPRLDDVPPWESLPLDAYQDMPASREPDWAGQLEPEMPVWDEPSAVNLPPVPLSTPVTVQHSVPSPMGGEHDDARWTSNDLLRDCGDEWAELISHSGVGGRLRQLALQASRQVEGQTWLLTLPAEHKHLVSDKAIGVLAQTFSEYLGWPIQIQVELGNPAEPTPLHLEQQRLAALLAGAQQSLAQDPHIQFLIERFGAELDADSIQPLKH